MNSFFANMAKNCLEDVFEEGDHKVLTLEFYNLLSIPGIGILPALPAILFPRK